MVRPTYQLPGNDKEWRTKIRSFNNNRFAAQRQGFCRGAKAVSVAEEIQDKVKSAVQNMLGLTVAKVNVTICGVDLSEKE